MHTCKEDFINGINMQLNQNQCFSSLPACLGLQKSFILDHMEEDLTPRYMYLNLKTVLKFCPSRRFEHKNF
jgi:hypothetical protein